MTYEEVEVQQQQQERGGLSPDKNMWGQQCRSDLHENQEPRCRLTVPCYNTLLKYTVHAKNMLTITVKVD